MHSVLNNTIGSPYNFEYPKLSREQEQEILAKLFEQILLFDRVTITTDRLNFPLFFLIKHININIVEELIEKGIINFLIWSPLLFTGRGRDQEDGTRDESLIYGQPPIVAAALSDEDTDLEKHIDRALSFFQINRERKRIFKRLAFNAYIVPDGLKNSGEAAELVINAYSNNTLSDFGLAYNKEPNQLNMNERDRLMDLGYKVLETSLLAKYKLKSFENYDHYKICEKNLKNIGDAYKVTENTSEILRIESIPNLRHLYKIGNLNFRDLLDLRYKPTAKYFRNWINNVSANENALPITKEYINEIKGTKNFFNSNTGKLIRNVSLFGLGETLQNAITGSNGSIAGFALSLLDTFWLDNVLKGKNPSMFLGDIEQLIQRKSN